MGVYWLTRSAVRGSCVYVDGAVSQSDELATVDDRKQKTMARIGSFFIVDTMLGSLWEDGTNEGLSLFRLLPKKTSSQILDDRANSNEIGTEE